MYRPGGLLKKVGKSELYDFVDGECLGINVGLRNLFWFADGGMSDIAIGIVLGYVWAEPRSMWPNLMEMVMSFSVCVALNSSTEGRLSLVVPC